MSGRRYLLVALAAGAFAGTLGTAVTEAPASPDTAVASAASPSGAATPGSDATIVATSFTVAKGQAGSAVATCPDGKRLVGGGVGHPAPPGVKLNETVGTVLSSGPVDETGSPGQTRSGDVAQSWLAAGTGGQWRVYAICSATSDATVQATTFGKAADGSFAKGSTSCPAGTRVVGGGVNRLDPLSGKDEGLLGPNVIVSEPLDQSGLTAGTESGTVARSWSASIILNGVNAAVRYQAVALCSAGSDATIVSKRFPVEVCVGCATGAVVACGPGKRALGGGIGVFGPVFGNLFQSQPLDETGEAAGTDTADVPRSWTAFVNVFTASSDPIEYRVSAICASDPPAAAPAPKPVSAARCAGLKATIVGTAGPNTLRGTPRADVIAGLGGNDRISGLGGNDVVCGGAGNDTIDGGPGNDRLAGEAGNDSLSGGPGNDSLVGGPGLDRLTGGPGVNTVKP